ncbi:unnamed protein product [Pleuronectes platessa]|uniref:Uncharacterized protein n=1 Tax=Pleuronectes platessa TaxID=8262 RepID=A0A9N7URF5_PLEPL|nr:unnamed protein product [Pleuronectes platessa]
MYLLKPPVFFPTVEVHLSNLRPSAFHQFLACSPPKCAGPLFTIDRRDGCKCVQAGLYCGIFLLGALMSREPRLTNAISTGTRGETRETGVHKKTQIKGCSLCSVSPVLDWNGRNVAGRPTGPPSLLPLMNFKRPFSFKAGCWLIACRLAEHSGKRREREEDERSTGRREGGVGTASWHLDGTGYWMSLTVRDNRTLCMGSCSRSVVDPGTGVETK